MMKFATVSPWRGRSDSVSLASSVGTSSGSGSPSPGHTPPPSRASSCASLVTTTGNLSSLSPADSGPLQTTIKVYANCLRPDIEYKTLSITYQTTCREVVQNLLNKYKMRHRDPRLFYLTMEVIVKRPNVRTVLPLDEDERPARLQTCHPGDSRFCLQTRRGGLVKIYDSALMSGSKYKSLLVSEKTTADELIQMLLSCYNSSERVEQFSLYEVCEGEEYQRKLHPDDSPLRVTQKWTGTDRHLRIRRNPDYNPHRRMSMWSSDSSIALAMSRIQLQTPQHFQHLFSQKNQNNHTHNHNHGPHKHVGCRHAHHCHNNHDSNNNANNANKNILASLQQPRIVVPHPSQLPPGPQQNQLKSLPSTPLSTKHISTAAYANYENYLFI